MIRPLIFSLVLFVAIPIHATDRPGPVAKVSVAESGEISLDGRHVSIQELRQAFRILHEEQGAVWYYRANPREDPPAVAMEVIQAIVDAGLPVRLATKPDFSEFATPPGGAQKSSE